MVRNAGNNDGNNEHIHDDLLYVSVYEHDLKETIFTLSCMLSMVKIPSRPTNI